MNISKHTALHAAAWTAVGVIGLGAGSTLANARPSASPAALLAQASGPSGPSGPSGAAQEPGEKAEGRRKGDGEGRAKGRRGRGRGHHLGAKGRVLHGEATVRGRDGVIRVVVTQGGTVTAASAESITVRSDDGYTSTWPLTDATTVRKGRGAVSRSDLEVGDVVQVVGEKTAAGVVTKVVHVRPAAAAKAAEDDA